MVIGDSWSSEITSSAYSGTRLLAPRPRRSHAPRCRCDQRPSPPPASERRGINAANQQQGRKRVTHVIDAPASRRLVEDAEEELIAVYLLPREHWTEPAVHQPLECVRRKSAIAPTCN